MGAEMAEGSVDGLDCIARAELQAALSRNLGARELQALSDLLAAEGADRREAQTDWFGARPPLLPWWRWR
jgi:hypothetical protein